MSSPGAKRVNLHLLPNRDDVQRQADWHADVVNRLDIRKLLPAHELEANSLKFRKAKWSDWFAPLVLLKCRAKNGKDVYLCDFASAGNIGSPYLSWLPIRGADLKGLPSWIHPCT